MGVVQRSTDNMENIISPRGTLSDIINQHHEGFAIPCEDFSQSNFENNDNYIIIVVF